MGYKNMFFSKENTHGTSYTITENGLAVTTNNNVDTTVWTNEPINRDKFYFEAQFVTKAANGSSAVGVGELSSDTKYIGGYKNEDSQIRCHPTPNTILACYSSWGGMHYSIEYVGNNSTIYNTNNVLYAETYDLKNIIGLGYELLENKTIMSFYVNGKLINKVTCNCAINPALARVCVKSMYSTIHGTVRLNFGLNGFAYPDIARKFNPSKSLFTSKTAINLLDKTKVTGFTIDGIQPANTNRKVAFKVDDVWNKLTTDGALSPLPTQAITSDSVLAEGNTAEELTALTNVPALVGKMVYPAIALYASEEAEVMPTFGMTVKAEIDTTVNAYSYTTYSQEYTISEGDDIPIVSIVAETELKGNGNVAITARIKQNNEWTEYMNLNDVQMKKASAVQLKAVYTVQSTTGNDSAEIKGVIIKYNTSGAITSNSTTDIVTVTERFTNDLTCVHAYVKHKELVDAQIKVYCSLRKTPQKRTMYQFGNGTGALKTFTLLDSGINQDTLLVYADGKLVYDYGYNTENSEITITADKDAALSATYEYGWEHSEWLEMEQGVSQINDSGAFTTEYSYTIPAHEGELTVTAIKYELLRPEGKVTDDVIGIGTGKRQIIQLPHYARKETISCNGKWSYDYDSKRLTVIAPEGDNIVISYDWIAESPQVYGVMAGWAD